MTTFMMGHIPWLSANRTVCLSVLLGGLFLQLGCEIDHLLDNSDGRLKSALEAAHRARVVSPLASGTDLDIGLKKMMDRPLASRIDELAGFEQSLSIDVQLASDGLTPITLADDLSFRVDELGHWELIHRTEYQEIGERKIKDARRCRWFDSQFFTGSESGPMKAYLRLNDEGDRCANSFQDTLTTLIEFVLPRSRIMDQTGSDEPKETQIHLSLALDPSVEQMGSALPLAWPSGDAKSEAIWGPRDFLYNSHSVLKSVDGQIKMERESGLIREAKLTIRAAFTKREKPVLMTISAQQTTTKWDGKVLAPREIEEQQSRQRIFKERQALLGIPLPKSGGRTTALPAPGDAPRLVLTPTGALTTERPEPSESNLRPAVDVPTTEDFDEDRPE